MARKSTVADDRLDEYADELYTVPPEAFIASRDEHVKALVGQGDKALASAVQGLRKPTLAAWAVNLLVHDRREQVEKLVALGPELAEAQRGLDGEALQTLAARRQRVVHALVREARELAADAGHPVGGAAAYEVESTLHAALADPDVAERVLSGRLLRPESYAGLGPLPDVAERPRPAARVAAQRTARDANGAGGAAVESTETDSTEADKAEAERAAAERAAEERRRAEQRLAEAREMLADAERRHADITAQREDADRVRAELDERAAALREQLADVDRRTAEVDLDRRRLGKEAERAAGQVSRARRQVGAAERRLG